MKLFIWHSVEQVSYHYHPEGGLVVIAENLTEARKLANAEPNVNLDPSQKPDVKRECAGPSAVFVFPDAGCC